MDLADRHRDDARLVGSRVFALDESRRSPTGSSKDSSGIPPRADSGDI